MSYDPSDVWLKDLQSTHGLVDVDDMEMDHDDMSGDMDSEMSGDTEGDG